MSEGFHPGGERGKLHRELHIPEGEKIPHARLEAAMGSSDTEIRNDAIRANTMEHWHHHGHHSSRRRYGGHKHV
jgi:hypothetical protein